MRIFQPAQRRWRPESMSPSAAVRIGVLLIAAVWLPWAPDRSVTAAQPTSTEQVNWEDQFARTSADAAVLSRRGRFLLAATTMEQALLFAGKRWGQESEPVAAGWEWIAQEREKAHQWLEAEEAWLRTSELFAKLLGAEHWRTVTSRQQAAYVSEVRRLTPEQHRQLATMEQLSIDSQALSANNEFSQAAARYEQSLTLHRRLFSDNHPRYSQEVIRMGELAEAAACFREAVAIDQRTLEPHHSRTWQAEQNLDDTLSQLADRHRSEGNLALARKEWQEVLDYRISRFTKTHWQSQRARADLAALVKLDACSVEQQRSWLQAERFAREATAWEEMLQFSKAYLLLADVLTTRRSLLGPHDVLVADLLRRRGELAEMLDDLEQAQAAYQEALDIAERTLGVNHPETSQSLYDVARILLLRSGDARARLLLQRSLAIRARQLGEEHTDTRRVREILERIDTIDLPNDAPELWCPRRRQLFGRAAELMEHARRLAREGQTGDALPVAEKTLELVSWVYGPHSVAAANREHELADMYLLDGQFSLAAKRFQQVVEKKQTLFGEQHWRVRDAQASLLIAERLVSGNDECRRAWQESQELLREASKVERFPAEAVEGKAQLALDKRLPWFADIPLALAECHEVLAEQEVKRTDWLRAARHYESVLTLLRQALGPVNPRNADRLRLLGVAQRNARQLETSLATLRKSLEVLRESGLADKEESVQALNELGATQRQLNQFAEARQTFSAALTLAQKLHGHDHEQPAMLLIQLGLTHSRLGDQAAARQYFEQAISISSKLAGSEQTTAAALQNLGDMLSNAGEYASARVYQQQAFDMRCKRLGTKHRLTLTSSFQLALTSHSGGHWEEATQRLRQVSADFLEEFGSDDEDYQGTLVLLALWNKRQAEKSLEQADILTARSLLEEAMKVLRNSVRMDAETAASVRELLAHVRVMEQLSVEQQGKVTKAMARLAEAETLASDKQFREAIPHAQAAYQVRREALGANHPFTGQAAILLANCHVQAGDPAAAEPLYRATAESFRQVLGETHPESIGTLALLAAVLSDVGRFEEAERLFRQASDGAGPRKDITRIIDLAWVKHLRMRAEDGELRGEFKQTIAWWQQAESLGARLFTSDSLDTADLRRRLKRAQKLAELPKATQERVVESQRALGAIQHAMTHDELAAALRLAQRTLQDLEEVWGAEHWDLVRCLFLLGDIHKRLAQFPAAQRAYDRAVVISRREYGPAHLQVAEGLNKLGLLAQMHEDDDARKQLESALAIYRAAYGAHHFDTALALRSLGAWHARRGDLRAACSFYANAVRALEPIGGNTLEATAEARQRLGELQTELEEYAEARSHLEAALAGFERLFGQEHPMYSQCRISLAALDRNTGDYATATVKVEQSLAALRKSLGPHSLPVLKGTCELAHLIALQGDELRARRLLTETLDAAHHTWGRQSLLTARILRWIGSRFEVWGDWDQARQLLEEALEIARKTAGNSRLQEARTMHDLGAVLLRAGDYTTGRRYLEEALTISREHLGPRHAELATLLHDVGVALACIGSQDSARIYLEEALAMRRALFGSDDLGASATVNALGLLLRNDDPEAARGYFAQHLELCLRLLARESPPTARTLRRVADQLIFMNRDAEALPYLERALATLREELGEDHPATLEALRAVAKTRRVCQGPQEALPSYRLALEWTRRTRGPEALETADCLLKLLARRQDSQGADHPDTANAQLAYSEALWKAGRSAEAWDLAIRGAKSVAQTRARYLATSTQDEHRFLTGFRRELLEALMNMAESQPRLTDEQCDELLEIILHWKAVGNQSLQARQEALLLERDPLAVKLAAELRAAGDRLVKRQMRVAFEEWSPETPKELDRLRVEYEELGRRLSEQVQEFASLRRNFQAGAAGIAQQLEADSVLVEIVKYRHGDLQASDPRKAWGKPRYAAVLLWPAQPRTGVDPKSASPMRPRFVPLGESESIERVVTAWRQAVEGNNLGESLERDLRDAIWMPLDRVLPAEIQRLYVIPDGDLALAPWEAIRLTDGRYLIERLRVSYLESGRDRIPRPRPSGRAGPSVVLADPDYEVLNEVSDQATLSMLSPNQTRSADRRLAELRFRPLPGFSVEAALDLWGSELVILSACETGLGEVQVGEGVLGLRRAFQHAGAETVVASLWKVPDEETETLITRFVSLWLQGRGRSAALRQAQREMIQKLREGTDPKRRGAPPWYWAGFICHGRSD